MPTARTAAARSAFALGLLLASASRADEPSNRAPSNAFEGTFVDFAPLPRPAPASGAASTDPGAIGDDEGPDVDAPAALAVPDRLPDLSGLVAAPVRGLESSGFGWRDDPIRHRRRFHSGEDYRAPRGTPVYASAGGVVITCRRHGGYGRMIVLDHGGGLTTRYGHLSVIGVRCSDRVDPDQLIGAVGSTGRATGPHLHFEVRIDGRAVAPALAVHLGNLQRDGRLDEARTLATTLRPEAQAATVSAIDPPRAGAVAREPLRKKPRS